MTLSDFIKELQSLEVYSFTREEFKHAAGKEDQSVTNDLSYLTSKGDILPLRKGFYLIIPARYSKLGILPLELYVDKLLNYLKRNYYISLYSAAKHHGAAHQQIQREYIITDGHSLLDIKKNCIDIKFFTSSTWPNANIIQKKSDAGYYNLSDPALTAVDLIYHQRKLGGINRMLSNLDELMEVISADDIYKLLGWYPHKSVLQRLGFLMDQVSANNQLSTIIFSHLMNESFFPVLLSPRKSIKAGSVDNKWKVDVNLKLESDL